MALTILCRLKATSRVAAMTAIVVISCWSCRRNLPTESPSQQLQHWLVKGTVENEIGMSITGANLEFHDSRDSAKAVSDSLGHFEVRLLAGRYFLTADKAGHLQYSNTVEVAAPVLELRVILSVDPMQDYLPLAVGNWWEYDFTESSGYDQTRLASGMERWEIISLSKETGKISYVMRVEQKGKQNLNDLGYRDFTSARNITITESNGEIVLMPFGTVLTHFMRAGETITSPLVVCDTSKVSAGMPVLVDNREIATLAVVFIPRPCLPERIGYAGTQLLVARQIGVVSQETQTRSVGGHSWSKQNLVLRRYFIQVPD